MGIGALTVQNGEVLLTCEEVWNEKQLVTGCCHEAQDVFALSAPIRILSAGSSSKCIADEGEQLGWSLIGPRVGSGPQQVPAGRATTGEHVPRRQCGAYVRGD